MTVTKLFTADESSSLSDTQARFFQKSKTKEPAHSNGHGRSLNGYTLTDPEINGSQNYSSNGHKTLTELNGWNLIQGKHALPDTSQNKTSLSSDALNNVSSDLLDEDMTITINGKTLAGDLTRYSALFSVISGNPSSEERKALEVAIGMLAVTASNYEGIAREQNAQNRWGVDNNHFYAKRPLSPRSYMNQRNTYGSH